MRKIFFQGATGVIVIFDLTNRESFDNVEKWIADSRSDTPDADYILVGNKLDLLKDRKVSYYDGITKSRNLKCISYIETSGLNGTNVVEAFDYLGIQLLSKYG
jgi:Ras-related protein Rab-1A